MKEFSLEEYLKNPDREIVTRDGRNATIHCTNYQGAFPIVVEIEGKYNYVDSSIYDLFFAPEKHEGWINIYADINDNSHPGNHIFKSKEEAEEEGEKGSGYVTTIKIEWEK